MPVPARADSAIQVDPVHVTSGTTSDSATSLPTSQPLDATQPTSVVDRADLDRYVAATGNYDDAIRLLPSVIDVSPNGFGLGKAQILSIRGFADGQYNVTFDGISFADSDDFTLHSSAYFVARDLASVTVDRGPGTAATLGDATFGGPIVLRSIGPPPRLVRVQTSGLGYMQLMFHDQPICYNLRCVCDKQKSRCLRQVARTFML